MLSKLLANNKETGEDNTYKGPALLYCAGFFILYVKSSTAAG